MQLWLRLCSTLADCLHTMLLIVYMPFLYDMLCIEVYLWMMVVLLHKANANVWNFNLYRCFLFHQSGFWMRSFCLLFLLCQPSHLLLLMKHIVYLNGEGIPMSFGDLICFSGWSWNFEHFYRSHNFRPSFMRLRASLLHKTLNVRSVLAMTATATTTTLDAIMSALDIPSTNLIQKAQLRDNFHLSVSLVRNRQVRCF